MRKQVVHTDKVPPARVPLSQAIKVGDWVFASGQLGNDPRTGRLAEGGIGPETRPAPPFSAPAWSPARGSRSRPSRRSDHRLREAVDTVAGAAYPLSR